MKLRIHLYLTVLSHFASQQYHGGAVHAAHSKVIMDEDPVHDSFIVVFKDPTTPPDDHASASTKNVSSSMQSKVETLTAFSNVQVTEIYEKAIQGFTAKMTLEEAEAMADSADIAYIQQDTKIYAPSVDTSSDLSVQNIAAKVSWGLDRIDQEKLPLNSKYYPPGSGKGVTAYIIDTGIRISHNEFENRASFGTNTSGDGKDYDCDGHGTHVAGTVAGKKYGVANKANVVDVKVIGCNGSGSVSAFISGVEWIMNNVKKPATVNASVEGPLKLPMNEAVNNLHNSGIPTVVAAGNKNADACNTSPASATDVITVGATIATDTKWQKSNWGTCIDIMAPGNGIKSAGHTSDTSVVTMNGTSMASPHVCGAVALLLERGISAANVRSELLSMATSDALTNLGSGTPNKLLHIHRCLQSTAMFEFGEKKRTCKWVIPRKSRHCKKNNILSYCPSTCDACEVWGNADANDGNTNDNDNLPFFTSKNGRAWTCEKLQNLKERRRKNLCKNLKFYSTCRITCNEEMVLVNFDEVPLPYNDHVRPYRTNEYLTFVSWNVINSTNPINEGTGMSKALISGTNVGYVHKTGGWLQCRLGSFSFISAYMTTDQWSENTESDVSLYAYRDNNYLGALSLTLTVHGPIFVSNATFPDLATFTNIDKIYIKISVPPYPSNRRTVFDNMVIKIHSPCN